MDNGGKGPFYDGEDYGLYQIYGKHILYGSNALLYIGKATKQTFSRRFKWHIKWWLTGEESIRVYIGTIYDPKKHSRKDNWRSWERDVEVGEKMMIYKYSPNYNSLNISNPPGLGKRSILLVHKGKRNRLKALDRAPEDFE